MPMKNISIGGVIILDRAQLENDEKEEVRLRKLKPSTCTEIKHHSFLDCGTYFGEQGRVEY